MTLEDLVELSLASDASISACKSEFAKDAAKSRRAPSLDRLAGWVDEWCDERCVPHFTASQVAAIHAECEAMVREQMEEDAEYGEMKSGRL